MRVETVRGAMWNYPHITDDVLPALREHAFWGTLKAQLRKSVEWGAPL